MAVKNGDLKVHSWWSKAIYGPWNLSTKGFDNIFCRLRLNTFPWDSSIVLNNDIYKASAINQTVQTWDEKWRFGCVNSAELARMQESRNLALVLNLMKIYSPCRSASSHASTACSRSASNPSWTTPSRRTCPRKRRRRRKKCELSHLLFSSKRVFNDYLLHLTIGESHLGKTLRNLQSSGKTVVTRLGTNLLCRGWDNRFQIFRIDLAHGSYMHCKRYNFFF